MDTHTDRREFTRVHVQMDVEVAIGEAQTVQGRMHDLSMKGLYLSCDTPLPVGAGCCTAILLGNDEAPTRIEADGVVVRAEDRGMAIQFTEILGLDSFDHLRNLVKSNAAAHTEQVEAEFRSHLGIKRRLYA